MSLKPLISLILGRSVHIVVVIIDALRFPPGKGKDPGRLPHDPHPDLHVLRPGGDWVRRPPDTLHMALD